MDRKTAQGHAIDALIWLTENKQYLDNFFILSGAKIDDLRTRSKEADFLCSVLDFFMTSDNLIVSLSKKLNIAPEQVQIAHSVLSDENLCHWT